MLSKADDEEPEMLEDIDENAESSDDEYDMNAFDDDGDSAGGRTFAAVTI